MASRNFPTSPKVLSLKPYTLNITFYPDGTSNPTYSAQDTKGVASLVRNGTAGEWLITLQDTYKRLVSKLGSIQMATAADLTFQFATIANVGTASNVTVLVRALAVATATDIAADANNSVSVQLNFDDSDV